MATKFASSSFAMARLMPIADAFAEFPFLAPGPNFLPPLGFLNFRMFSTLRARFSFFAFVRQAIDTTSVRVMAFVLCTTPRVRSSRGRYGEWRRQTR